MKCGNGHIIYKIPAAVQKLSKSSSMKSDQQENEKYPCHNM